ncbi:MAG: hypothetical protein JWN25_2238 [Verrucomicrobiales bacterium]|nr:hypothetical protein [Verrucomicrobiales bacterium]MDB6129342.1 hypothetical protein [Verrucomicrobiales bacterium]
MLRWLKFLIGLLLIPVCLGGINTLYSVVKLSGAAQMVWIATLAGIACWFVIFLLLPKPMWIYVFGHELTHVLWTWLFGGKVKKFKVTSKGGHVVISKSNFLIALAPYFFPLYVILVVIAFVSGDLIWGWSRYVAFFHLFVGAAYAFHLTLTVHILRTRQTDITDHGYLFSFVIIFLGNLTVLMVGIPLLATHQALFQVFLHWVRATDSVFHRIIYHFG